MKRNKNVIVLDQGPLRLQAINEIESWHDRIELLEIEIQKFQDTDLKLYNDWIRLTLNDLQEENNSLIDKYQKLALFHNWVVFTSEEQSISLPHAFFLMSEEELKFQKGSQEEKEQIDKLRQERTNKIKEELREGIGEDFDDEGDFESEVDTDTNAYEDPDSIDDQDWIKREELQIRQLREKFQKEILFFENLTDKKIAKIMRRFDDGIILISECVYVCGQCYRYDIIERIWAFCPIKIKNYFNADFEKQMGITLEQHLDLVKNDAQGSLSSDEADEEFNFKSHFENPFSNIKNEVLPENIEAAKIVYRRIMMKIHPDKLSTEFVSIKRSWLDRLWKKIQTAYDKADVKALHNLHLQVLITLKKYDDLDYSELRTGSLLLKSELTRIRNSHEDTLQHPAWGFSKLKSYKKLEKEVAEPYKKTSKELKKEIKRMEKAHADLKDFVDLVLATGGFERKRRRKPATRRKRQSRVGEHQHPMF
jgi:hypothetical protein